MVFFFNDTATTEIYTLSLHDALPICLFFGRIANFINGELWGRPAPDFPYAVVFPHAGPVPRHPSQLYEAFGEGDRKSTRLNSSHANISYAVFCLKKKTTL